MANANPVRIGQQLGAGDTRALFLKLFSGEVMTTFNAGTVMKDRIRSKTITSGKSWQFPAIGKTKAAYHTPGAEITGDIIQQDEKVITIDDVLLASTFIPRIDEAMSHFDVRGEYSKQMGQALAQTYDRNLLSLAVKASRDTGAGGIGVGAVDQTNAVSVGIGAAPTDQAIVDAFYKAAQSYMERNIPLSDVVAIVPPSVYWKLVQNDKIQNKFYSEGQGDYAAGKLLHIANIPLVISNNLALDHTAAVAKFPDYNNKYAVDASKTLVQMFTPDAISSVKLMDMTSEMEYDIRRQGTLMVSKMAVGHGVTRPEGLYEIKAVAP